MRVTPPIMAAFQSLNTDRLPAGAAGRKTEALTSLLLYLAVTVAGYLIGSKLKRRAIRLSWVGPMQTMVIIVLVFLMGSRIGSNDEIVSSLDTIGLVSFAYTVIIMIVTLAAYSLVRRLLGFDRYGIRREIDTGRMPVREAEGNGSNRKAASRAALQGDRCAESLPDTAAGETDHAAKAGPEINKLTILIVVFVGIGIAAGYLFLPAGFIRVTGLLLTISLCMLLVLIGIDIGTEGTLAENFRSAGWRVLVFPFVSMGAMAVSALIAALLLPMNLQDSLCIGSGFAWYSLAPAMLAEYSTQVSAISFMHNVFREILGILLIPLAARRVGYIESYGICGSPSMDVCLPVIERATSSDVAVYSFINGAVLSAAVPILVSFFMNL